MPEPLVRPKILRIAKFGPILPHLLNLRVSEQVVIINERLIAIWIAIVFFETSEIGEIGAGWPKAMCD